MVSILSGTSIRDPQSQKPAAANEAPTPKSATVLSTIFPSPSARARPGGGWLNVRFYPNSDRRANMLKSTIRANSRLMHRSSASLFDHLVGAAKQRKRHRDAERLRGR